MPTYEYECMDCGHRFEKFQSINDEPVKKCIKCSGKVRRLIGAGAGIIFKGTGFYHTDYKLNKEKKQDKEAKEDKENKGDKKEDNKGSSH